MRDLGIPDCAVIWKAMEEEDSGFLGAIGPGRRGRGSGVAIGDTVWGEERFAGGEGRLCGGHVYSLVFACGVLA